METTVKKQTAFRFDSELLEMLKAAARKEHRSLNNFVETLLMRFMYDRPNADTREAIEEARSGKTAGGADMTSFKTFMNSIDGF